jgi:hypothetical protein
MAKQISNDAESEGKESERINLQSVRQNRSKPMVKIEF